VLHREVVLAMPIEVNDLRTVLDRKTDPHVDIAVVVGGHVIVHVAGPQPERVQRSGRVPGEQQAVHELPELLRRVAVAAGARDAEVQAGRGGPEVAPPAREHAGAHRLLRLEERYDVVQQRVREGAEAVGGTGRATSPRAGFEPGRQWGTSSSGWPAQPRRPRTPKTRS